MTDMSDFVGLCRIYQILLDLSDMSDLSDLSDFFNAIWYKIISVIYLNPPPYPTSRYEVGMKAWIIVLPYVGLNM